MPEHLVQTTFDKKTHFMDQIQILFIICTGKWPRNVNHIVSVSQGPCKIVVMRKQPMLHRPRKIGLCFLFLEYVGAVDKGAQCEDADEQNHGPCL